MQIFENKPFLICSMPKKSYPILYSNAQYKYGQDFLDYQLESVNSNDNVKN